MDNKILVTGCAGFIGMHLCIDLLKDGYEVLGIDEMNDYYDIQLKKNRMKKISNYKSFSFQQIDISDYEKLNLAFLKFKPRKVV